MKKLICWVLAMLLCLSGFALSEEEMETNGIVIEYPSLGFNLRLHDKYLNFKGFFRQGLALALDSDIDLLETLLGIRPIQKTDVGIFTATYLCLSLEEYNANAQSLDPEVQDRISAAEMPFISLLIVRDGLSQKDVDRIIGGHVDISAMEVQAKVDGYTFYKDTIAGKKEVPDPAYAEEYAELMSHLDDILDCCDYYAPCNPYAAKSGTKLSFETTDLDGNPITSDELFGRHEYTLLNIWASWCGFCIEELAGLDALNNRLATVDCGVVGLLEDSAKDSTVESAKRMMAQLGAHYLCIKAPEGLENMLLVESFPTSYIVDRSGTVVGTAIVGAHLASYEETIMNLLNTKNVETKEVSNQGDKITYTVTVVDQNGEPVPEAAVGFCLDTGCIPVETDENGAAVYSGTSARYHIKVVDAPDEYDYPDDTDCYIGPESVEMTLVITKK